MARIKLLLPLIVGTLAIAQTPPIRIGVDASVYDERRLIHATLQFPAPASTIVAVDDRAFTDKHLRQAVTNTATSNDPMTTLVKDGEYCKTFRLDYQGGERFPHLVRDETKPDVMADIVKAHAAGAK